MARINWGKISKQISESAALKDKQREAQARLYDAQAGHYGRLIDSQLEAQNIGNQHDLAKMEKERGYKKEDLHAADLRDWHNRQLTGIDKREDFNRGLGVQHWVAGGDSNESQAIMDSPGYANVSGMTYPREAKPPTGQFMKLKDEDGVEKPYFADPATQSMRLLTPDDPLTAPAQYGNPATTQQNSPGFFARNSPGREQPARRVVNNDSSPVLWNEEAGGRTGYSLRHGSTTPGQQGTAMDQVLQDARKSLGENFNIYDDPTPEQANYLTQLKKDPVAWKAFRSEYENR